LFRRHKALALFASVFRETERRCVFRIRGLRLEVDRLEFYIRPEDGGELPAIMNRLKQVFARRYNREEGRSGRIWGDRYWSRIVEGEPPEEEGEPGGQGAVPTHRVRPCGGQNAENPWFPLVFPLSRRPRAGITPAIRPASPCQAPIPFRGGTRQGKNPP
ncbi:MAG: hypothetical protein LBF60_10000, partial [Treponema sp.]|jgi:hypothetical protein|nr:hypothetical protein [Treponema sp.]